MATHPRNVRLEPEMWEALERLAKADQRSVASLIRKVLDDYILARPSANSEGA